MWARPRARSPRSQLPAHLRLFPRRIQLAGPPRGHHLLRIVRPWGQRLWACSGTWSSSAVNHYALPSFSCAGARTLVWHTMDVQPDPEWSHLLHATEQLVAIAGVASQQLGGEFKKVARVFATVLSPMCVLFQPFGFACLFPLVQPLWLCMVGFVLAF